MWRATPTIYGDETWRWLLSWGCSSTGYSNYVSKDGAKYYSDLIDALLEKGIEPVVTLYHWDLPQSLQDLGKVPITQVDRRTPGEGHRACRHAVPLGHAAELTGSRLINALLEKGIEPIVTLYHWDLPQSLQDLDALPEKGIVPVVTLYHWDLPQSLQDLDWFASYARVVFSLYADRVKTWITINEPIVFCDLTYSTGILAPGFEDTVFAPYLCNRHGIPELRAVMEVQPGASYGVSRFMVVSYCAKLLHLPPGASR
ncbi:Uncharacterized protein OBRU01_19063 [Operophtera brumata]|uniref:Glucosidase n=1 Tax=Operophtera brumata TaxID=104452 RepID=A0A0L7KYU3_OPEBR|nr:Uncharacterized protein OBRU01_19063 [Operophtera brumata]